MHSEDIGSWLGLIRADEVGPVTFRNLVEYFGSPDEVLNATPARLTQVKGVGSKIAGRIISSSKSFDVQKELGRAESLGVRLIHSGDHRYPPALKKILDYPPILYIKGDIVRADNLAIAIVGSRSCSHYGQEQASRFAYMLAQSGFTIVSGMARGIDTAAHRGALAAGGRTIAVQGCGLSKVYPPENEELFEKISRQGACISELGIDFEPKAENFPARNRIIAGLSMATLVIEAGYRSGAMITARLSMEYGREVMAVPGRIDSQYSKGAHKLIKEGAKLVESVEDIMDALGYIGRDLKEHVIESASRSRRRVEKTLFDEPKLDLSENENKILETLTREPMHIDEVISLSGLGAGAINAVMMTLRLKGLIKQLPGNMFVKN